MYPKISVVTSTYNSIQFIEKCFDSLHSQTYRNFEHIVQDGGSSDGTVNYIESFGRKCPKVFFECKPDNGIYAGLNNALERCTGDYVCFMHSDDEFYDLSVLDSQVKLLNATAADIIFGDLVYTDASGFQVKRKWQTENFQEKSNYGAWVPPHTTMVVKRNILKDIRFNERYRIAADFDWSIKLLKMPGITVAHNQRFVTKMRSGGASTAGIRSEWIKFAEDIKILRENGLNRTLLLKKKIVKIPQLISGLGKK